MSSILIKLLAMSIIVAFAVFISYLISYPLMLLWNYCLVPATTVLVEVTWLQMWGITALLGFLFKSWNFNNK